jgi:hypothetical protein
MPNHIKPMPYDFLDESKTTKGVKENEGKLYMSLIGRS